MLTEQVQRRERLKLERIRRQKEYVEMILYPLEHVIRPVLDQLIEIDENEFFTNPVTPEEAPDYASIIDKPICFSIIQQKLERHEYTRLDQFKEDIQLIWENCMTYNTTTSKYYRIACKLKKASIPLLEEAEQRIANYPLNQGTLDVSLDPSIFDYEAEEEYTEIANEGANTSTRVEPIMSKEVSTKPRGSFFTNRSHKSLEETSVNTPFPRRPGRKRVTQDTSENYTVRETGAKQSSIEAWIRQESAENTTKKLSKRPIRKMSKSVVEVREGPSLVKTSSSVDKMVQTDHYLFLSLLQKFQTPEDIQRLEAEQQKDKDAYEAYKAMTSVQNLNQGIINVAEEAQEPLQENIQPQKIIPQSSVESEREKDITNIKETREVETDENEEEELNIIGNLPTKSTTTEPMKKTLERKDQKDDRTVGYQANYPLPNGLLTENINYQEIERSPEISIGTLSSSELSSNQEQSTTSQSNESSDQVKQERSRNNSSSGSSSRYKKYERGPMRATRSHGPSSAVEELKKRKRMTKEIEMLYNSVAYMERPVEKFKADNSKPAPVGWVYVESDDEDGAKSGSEEVVEEVPRPYKRSGKKRKIEQASLEEFEIGEVVWARVSGYPSHPARVRYNFHNEKYLLLTFSS